jgi:prephenate dehydrogenase
MRYQVGHDSFQVDSSLTAEELNTTEETAIRRGEQCDLVVLAVRAEQAGRVATQLSLEVE